MLVNAIAIGSISQVLLSRSKRWQAESLWIVHRLIVKSVAVKQIIEFSGRRKNRNA